MNRFFATACHPETMEPIFMREIEAPDFAACHRAAVAIGTEILAGSAPRITGITEIPQLRESFFIRKLAALSMQGPPRPFPVQTQAANVLEQAIDGSDPAHPRDRGKSSPAHALA